MMTAFLRGYQGTSKAAITADHDAELAELNRQYRNNFNPHAVIRTQKYIPSPIFVAASLGVARLLRIDFIEGSSPITFADQARRNLPEDVLAFCGVTGFVVNCTPDHSVEFDCEGKLIGKLSAAVQVRQANLSVAGLALWPDAN